MNDTKSSVIQRYFDELFNQGRTEIVDDLVHPEYVNHSPGWPELPRGREGIAIVVAALRKGLPDLHYTIEDMVVGHDAVAVRSTLRATHKGELFGMAPTGNKLEVAQMTIERFRDGKIVAHHRLTDDLTMQRQLGILPAA